MTLRAISKSDVYRQLNRAGITEAVQAAQIIEATRLYIQSELGEAALQYLEPLYVRHTVLVIRSLSPAFAQRLQEKHTDLLTYIYSITGKQLIRLQFKA